jgi:hypothetical protein
VASASRTASLALVLIGSGGIAADRNPARADPYPVAVLRALDKVTARVSTLKAPLNEAVAFGTLEIVVRHCDKRPPEEAPEAAAFLEIWEIRAAQLPASLFKGWMFASSPGLSAIEHPVYDVWVLDCVRHADSSASSSPTPSTP